MTADAARDAAVDYWLKQTLPEEMPVTATRLLVQGCDSPSLREVAGMTARDDPRTVRDVFVRALQELGVWLPDEASADESFARRLAQEAIENGVSPEKLAARVRDTWELDSLIGPDPDHSEAWQEFVLMGWLHGESSYEERGGDQRFLELARSLSSSE